MSRTFIIFWYSSLITYYINLRLSIICCLFSDDIYFSVGTSVEFFSVCEAVFGALREAVLSVLSAFLLPIKSSVSSAVFGLIVWSSSECISLAQGKSFWLYFYICCYLYFQKDRNILPFTNIQSLASSEYLILYVTH